MPDRTGSDIGLEVLLVPAHRGGDRPKAVAARLRGLGFDVTGVGEASLSLRVTRSEFLRLFRREPGPPAPADGFAAWTEPAELPVPDALAPWVESLAEARTAQRY
jgi:hypothetical protein